MSTPTPATMPAMASSMTFCSRSGVIRGRVLKEERRLTISPSAPLLFLMNRCWMLTTAKARLPCQNPRSEHCRARSLMTPPQVGNAQWRAGYGVCVCLCGIPSRSLARAMMTHGLAHALELGKECPICQENFVKGTELVHLPCTRAWRGLVT